ncbi:hypothetical protein [Polyangium jinanense]|uniref:Uncharacterized protein n=1 Tax=Polyangium jinanense TaxID=2829994 RepID=A0A9X3XEW1_9BACT|nr:hypothetical protein [Polyangium jinanense]MDC3958174.1 hypothetical protein [Polyangium jinanense]MDC3988140.1 hypothetical protein [Polyangium jinanense]
MRHISLIALFVGLNDLLTTRKAALVSFASGAASTKLLTARRDALAKLPSIAAGRPLADDLSAADARHDALGYSLWHLLEAYDRHPDIPEHIRAAARKIRAAFIPTLEDLGASYPAEAKAAMDRKPALVDLQPDLALFPVAGGGTLYDWADSFLNAGVAIDSLLSARADLETKTRKDATRLRGEVIGLLNRTRKNLALELQEDPSLPKDLDARIFGYFDLLEKSAADAAKSKASPEIPPPPSPVEATAATP